MSELDSRIHPDVLLHTRQHAALSMLELKDQVHIADYDLETALQIAAAVQLVTAERQTGETRTINQRI